MQNKVLKIVCLSIFVVAFGLFCSSLGGEFLHYVYIESASSGQQTKVSLNASTFFPTPLVMILVLSGLLFGLLLALFLDRKIIRFMGLAFGLSGFAYCLYVSISIINTAIDTGAGRTKFYNMDFSPCLFVYFASVLLFGILLTIALFNSVLAKEKKPLDASAPRN